MRDSYSPPHHYRIIFFPHINHFKTGIFYRSTSRSPPFFSAFRILFCSKFCLCGFFPYPFPFPLAPFPFSLAPFPSPLAPFPSPLSPYYPLSLPFFLSPSLALFPFFILFPKPKEPPHFCPPPLPPGKKCGTLREKQRDVKRYLK